MDEPTDEALMEHFCSGDDRAFEALFARLSSRVHSFLRSMVRDGALAEDLLQTTFLSVVRSRDRYQVGSKVMPWVYSIAANAARDALRYRNLRVEMGDEATRDVAVEPATGDPGLRAELERALLQLPEQQREAVVLHKVQGLTFEEIAEVLGTTSAAARIRAHRGYERLRALLAHLEAA